MAPTTKAVLVAAAHAVALCTPHAFAGINFNELLSKLSITHDPDRSTSTIAEKIKNISPVPLAADMPDPASYQLIKTFSSGSASSTSNASLGHITSNATTSFSLAAGTGVTQTDPGNNAWPGASSLKLGVDLLWDVTGAGFGNPAEAYVSIA